MPRFAVDSGERTISNERLNIAATSGKRFRCNFIEPGVVDYSDCGLGVELLRRETIEACLHTAIANPLTKGHISTRINAFGGLARGYIDKVGYDAAIGVFFCEGTCENDEARRLIKNGYRPSCGYVVEETGPGGRHNGVPYERELTRIKFHHLAIVPNPRYEGMDFRLNSKPKNMNPLKYITSLLRPKDGGAAGETETVKQEGTLAPDTMIEIDGKSVRLNELVELQQTADADLARENAISADAEIEVAPGRTVKLSALVKSYRANAAADEKEETEEEKKAKKERENALEQKRKDDEAKARENAQSFKILQTASRSAVPAHTRERSNSSGSVAENIERGRERYGSGVANGKN